MERGIPTAAELVEAVAEFLREELLPELAGSQAFNTRVALHVLGIVERELSAGSGPAEAHARRLASLGLASDEELATAIRDGRLDDRGEEVARVLREATRDRLRIANPGYLDEAT